jgi:hypothetical protein
MRGTPAAAAVAAAAAAHRGSCCHPWRQLDVQWSPQCLQTSQQQQQQQYRCHMTYVAASSHSHGWVGQTDGCMADLPINALHTQYGDRSLPGAATPQATTTAAAAAGGAQQSRTAVQAGSSEASEAFQCLQAFLRFLGQSCLFGPIVACLPMLILCCNINCR